MQEQQTETPKTIPEPTSSSPAPIQNPLLMANQDTGVEDILVDSWLNLKNKS